MKFILDVVLGTFGPSLLKQWGVYILNAVHPLASHIVRLDLNMIYMECLGVINFRKSLCTPHVSKFLFSKHHLLPCVNRCSACNLRPRIVILWVEF